MIAATPYDGFAKELVHYLKFERASAAAVAIAAALTPFLAAADYDVLTFVPTAPARIRARGYDQAARIARALARQNGLPCRAALARTGNQRQLGQGRRARQAQMQEAFYLRRTAAVGGKRVLLIDDVLTTGASCEAAARLLLQGGATSVTAAVFAVTVRRT